MAKLVSDQAVYEDDDYLRDAKTLEKSEYLIEARHHAWRDGGKGWILALQSQSTG
jgi:hypothetical protein